jgi:hypothetical protein
MKSIDRGWQSDTPGVGCRLGQSLCVFGEEFWRLVCKSAIFSDWDDLQCGCEGGDWRTSVCPASTFRIRGYALTGLCLSYEPP